ncbi:MAG: Mur ligase family protein [Oligoflexales bacterium]
MNNIAYDQILKTLHEGLLNPVVHNEHLLQQGSGSIQVDSRKVKPGDIFITWTQYENEARKNGAQLVIGSSPTCDIQVSCGRSAWTWLCAAAYQHTHRKLTLLGITGTNGKTSTAWIASALLRSAGRKVLTIGTLGAFFDEHTREPLIHTTPDPDVLFPLLQRAYEQQAIVVMEVSSHSIAQKKLIPLSFTGCAFTSFSQDHLDYHETMENYWNTKWSFVKEAKHVALFEKLNRTLPHAVTYGYDKSSDLHLSHHDESLQLSCSFFEGKAHIPWLGVFAEQNFAAAWLLASFAGVILPSEMWHGSTIPGRMQKAHHCPDVFIDYAHTPDALEQTLQSFTRKLSGKIIVLFGCGGDRDQEKRALMGEVATRLADTTVLTSDNPRSESPDRILDDIQKGCSIPITRISDRKAAIHFALQSANKNDIVILAGKGHETTQEVNGSRTPFDDVKIVQSYFQQKQDRDEINMA